MDKWNKIEHVIDVNQAKVETQADMILVDGAIFTFKNTGLTRRVFVNEEKGIVVKVPVSEYDQKYNNMEAEMWEELNDEDRSKFAETKLLSNGYIIQEYLHTLDDLKTLEWLGRDMTMAEIRFAQSCRNEVGFDEEGNLKCYDFDEYKKY